MPMFDPKKVASIIVSKRYGTDDRGEEMRRRTEMDFQRLSDHGENAQRAKMQAKTAAAESILRAISGRSPEALASSIETLVRMCMLDCDENGDSQ